MTTTEIREDQPGKFFLWEITTSDVPGEGGARRIAEMTPAGATQHELQIRQRIEVLSAELADLQAKLTAVLSWKAQMDALV